jgi:hypothetical protein
MKTESKIIHIGVPAIKKIVAEHYKLSSLALSGLDRKHKVVKPRYTAMYLISVILGMKPPEIAKHFPPFDRTTVIYALKLVRGELEIYPNYVKEIAEIKNKIDAYEKRLDDNFKAREKKRAEIIKIIKMFETTEKGGLYSDDIFMENDFYTTDEMMRLPIK